MHNEVGTCAEILPVLDSVQIREKVKAVVVDEAHLMKNGLNF